MKQVYAEANGGKLHLAEVPAPIAGPGTVRVITRVSVISAGTERGLLELAGSSLVSKARARPDLVKKLIDRARSGGWRQALDAALTRLATPIPLGYSAAGVVDAVGPAVRGVSLGDRVAIAGAGYANHAEINVAPENLVATFGDDLSFEEAAYATIASIALQGLRVGRPALGEVVVVVGLGLIGQITAQLLIAAGCRVIGVDPVASKRALSLELGAESVATPEAAEALVLQHSSGYGADAVYLTASTGSNSPVENAAAWTRKKGLIVVVGAIGMDIPRRPFYEKELELRMSTSYGPGRYDAEYEEGGLDYPYAYVRWTEQRNLAAALHLMRSGKLNVRALTTHRYRFEEALEAYALLQDQRQDALGIVLNYSAEPDRASSTTHRIPEAEEVGRLGVAVLGAGTYARQYLIPELKRNKQVALTIVAAAHGSSAASTGRRHGFSRSTTDPEVVFSDGVTRLVVIATRHDTHADLVCRALDAGKHAFVEKPLALSESQLDLVLERYLQANRERPVALSVGLNRRFAPMVMRIKDAFEVPGPLHMSYTVNPGWLPNDAWSLQEDQGGGMLVSEACHFVDVMIYLSGALPVRVYAESTSIEHPESHFSALLHFSDGSLGSLVYSTSGDVAAGKEALRVIGRSVTADLDDFRRLSIARAGRRRVFRMVNQDKGQASQVSSLVESLHRRGQGPIPFQELFAGMRAIFAIRRSLQTGLPVDVGLPDRRLEDDFREG